MRNMCSSLNVLKARHVKKTCRHYYFLPSLEQCTFFEDYDHIDDNNLHDYQLCFPRLGKIKVGDIVNRKCFRLTSSGTIIVDILVVKLDTSCEYILTFQFSFIHHRIVFQWYNILRYAIDRNKYLRNIYLVWGRYHFVHVGDVKCKQESSNIGRPFLIGLTGHIREGVSREPARML